jgi:hypothetical protein
MNFPELWAKAFESQAPHERSFLASLQRRMVQRIVPKLPKTTSPQDLTTMSVAGAAVAAAALFGCRWEAWLVLFVPVGMTLNWFGAAVDGPLGDFRQEAGRRRALTEHLADLFSQFTVIVAYGFSPFLSVKSAAVVLSCYLLFSAYAFIRGATGASEQMALIGIGATEFRILMALWPFAAIELHVATSAAIGFATLDAAIVILALVAISNLILKIIADSQKISSARG